MSNVAIIKGNWYYELYGGITIKPRKNRKRLKCVLSLAAFSRRIFYTFIMQQPSITWSIQEIGGTLSDRSNESAHVRLYRQWDAMIWICVYMYDGWPCITHINRKIICTMRHRTKWTWKIQVLLSRIYFGNNSCKETYFDQMATLIRMHLHARESTICELWIFGFIETETWK